MTTTDRTDALAERLFGAALGALELCSVYLGTELGLYTLRAAHAALAPGGAVLVVDERVADAFTVPAIRSSE